MRFLYDLNVLSLFLTKWFNLPCSNAYLVTQSVAVLPSRDIKHSLNINMSERKLSIISAFSVQIISYLGASDIIYSDVIDSFISEILTYKPWILASWHKRSWTERLTRICTSISLK